MSLWIMSYLSSECRFHLTNLSFFYIIYLWVKVIENIFNIYPMIIITVCSEILFGGVSCCSETSQFSGVSEEILVFTISFYHLNYVLLVLFFRFYLVISDDWQGQCEWVFGGIFLFTANKHFN